MHRFEQHASDVNENGCGLKVLGNLFIWPTPCLCKRLWRSFGENWVDYTCSLGTSVELGFARTGNDQIIENKINNKSSQWALSFSYAEQ